MFFGARPRGIDIAERQAPDLKRVLGAVALVCGVLVAGPAPAAAVAAPPSPATFAPAASAGPATLAVGTGAVVLDGWGGLHPTNGLQLNTAGAPYWPGWDIARSLSLVPDLSGGYVLDGWGGVHAFGNASRQASINASGIYWPNWDIARAVVVLPDQQSGYILDGYGGVHPFGPRAPALFGAPYWSGSDVARGLDIHYSAAGTPDGGWTLDLFGGAHSWGNAPFLPSPHYYSYSNPSLGMSGAYGFWRRLHVTGNGAAAYLVGRWGLADRIGNPPGIAWGPAAGYPTWGGWDIVEDIVAVNPQGSWTRQPVDRAAASAVLVSFENWDRALKGLGALGESAVLDGIAGNGKGYDLAQCGGSGLIGDRTLDMARRNYVQHPIPGCAGTRYVYDTYFPYWGVAFGSAGENIGWNTWESFPDAAWNINKGWLESPAHYQNLVSRSYTETGCGEAFFDGPSTYGGSQNAWIFACVFRG